jgi:hypothetical protein
MLAASKEFVLDVNAYTPKCMVTYLHPNTGRNKYVKRSDSSFAMLDAF